jgi:hypothetical protein
MAFMKMARLLLVKKTIARFDYRDVMGPGPAGPPGVSLFF